jgi:hypothetical protein
MTRSVAPRRRSGRTAPVYGQLAEPFTGWGAPLPHVSVQREVASQSTSQPPAGQATEQVAPLVQSQVPPVPPSVMLQVVPLPSQLGSLPGPSEMVHWLPVSQAGSLAAPVSRMHWLSPLHWGSLSAPQARVQLLPPKHSESQPPSQPPEKLPPSSSSSQAGPTPELPEPLLLLPPTQPLGKTWAPPVQALPAGRQPKPPLPEPSSRQQQTDGEQHVAQAASQ